LDGYLIALTVFLAWVAILIIGQRLKFWEKVHCQLWGPFLMVKTVKGRQLIDRLARRKGFWAFYGKVSVIVTIGSMVALTLVLVWESTLVFMVPDEYAPTPEMMLGIPGLNPIIPIWYGILGIAVAIIVHEFAHGILSRVANIKVESLGLVFLVFPMGAFVEPNEEEIKKTERKNRVRLFAAGPGTNMLAAFICFVVLILILAPAVKPVSPGAIVKGVATDSPAAEFGISAWSEILAVDGEPVVSAQDILNLTFNHPGDSIDVDILYMGDTSVKQMPGGVVVSTVTVDTPADDAGIKPGMIIESLDNEVINDLDELVSVIENASHDAPIGITVLTYGYDSALGKSWFIEDPNITSISLVDKWEYYEQNNPGANKDGYVGKSYMGVGSTVLGVSVVDSDYISSVYTEPFTGDTFTSSFKMIALPLLGFSPVEGPMAELYEPTGAMAALPNDVYWIFTNSVYWIFWINLMVGLTNALPAVPLDGGYVFRDLLKATFERANARRTKALEGRKPLTEAEMDRYISSISLTLSVIILFLIMWQLIGPRVF
jgi:membrane-associated protease RseP (regulator of RpoE activity)